MKKVPVIDVTDLYHFHQDKGDNIDLIAPYAMEEIDLRAVILDVTEHFRQKESWDVTGQFFDPCGPRDPGIIPVNQLNYIFDETVPCAPSPFHPMAHPADKLLDAPRYQQQGIALLLQTLRESDEPVDILVFGSLRAVAAAYNRVPALLREKVRRIHISAGASSPKFMEWNINLDPQAAVCLLRSGLPIDLYPCAGMTGPFDLARHNTYWRLDAMSFMQNMAPKLKSYLQYALAKSQRADFLRAMDEEADDSILAPFYTQNHNVWETAVWLEVSGRRLVQRASGAYRIVKPEEFATSDREIRSGLLPCALSVCDDGSFSFILTAAEGNCRIFTRENPAEYQQALNEAFPVWYQSFRV